MQYHLIGKGWFLPCQTFLCFFKPLRHIFSTWITQLATENRPWSFHHELHLIMCYLFGVLDDGYTSPIAQHWGTT